MASLSHQDTDVGRAPRVERACVLTNVFVLGTDANVECAAIQVYACQSELDKGSILVLLNVM